MNCTSFVEVTLPHLLMDGLDAMRYNRRLMTLSAVPVRAGLQPGNFLRQGGAAPGGASMEVDNVAGETDQDRGEGCAPFPEDNLPDGGSGGSARVIPGHSGRDWAAEIASRSTRMKEK